MSTEALRFEAVSKSFASAGREPVPVVCDIDIAVAHGESVAILGPSGSGKSTILRLAAGLETLTRSDLGTIRVSDHAPGAAGAKSALVFQAYSTFPWLTAEQNVMLALRQAGLPRAERRAAAGVKLASVRLTGLEKSFPAQLSGGERQRLAFACAIALKPELLLLDEPMGALDPLTREHLQLGLIRLWREQRCAMVLVTHDISEAVLLGQRVLLLSDRPGRIVLELCTSTGKPWLEAGHPPEALATMVRDYRGSAGFIELTNRLRDALADNEGQI